MLNLTGEMALRIISSGTTKLSCRNELSKICSGLRTSSSRSYSTQTSDKEYVEREERLATQPNSVKQWESVVGVEVHAQISSKSKLFSGAKTAFASLVNDQVAFFDAALPGTLPVLNRRCVEAAVLTALALSCDINKVSYFDRKHYFYADLPAGYQITQHRRPIAVNGNVNYSVVKQYRENIRKSARITSIQLEQDSGRSLHDEEDRRSLINLNRAGVGLMEIVTAPDFKSGDEVRAFIKELQLILRCLGTCDGKMEEGSLRVDASISVNRPGEPLGTRTEVKNINSIRNVAKAVDYEIKRHINEIEHGYVILNETRSYDTYTNATVPMRDKEMQHDYRFMPEPNLPPLHLFDDTDHVPEDDKSQIINIDTLRKHLPELPDEKRHKLWYTYKIPMDMISLLMSEESILELFKELVDDGKQRNPKFVANWLVYQLMPTLDQVDTTLPQSKVPTSSFAELIDFMESERISHQTARSLLPDLLVSNFKPIDIIQRQQSWQISDVHRLETLCRQIMFNNEKAVADYRKGKKRAINALLGQAKRATDGRANMKVMTEIMRRLLES